ncbi:hypothetical protein BH11BAC2_BH11BAC2_03000 [soil metagenome]
MNRTTLLFILLFFIADITEAQWTKISAVPNADIVDLVVYNNILYAASSSNQIFVSQDSGVVWNTIVVSTNPIDITSIVIFDNVIYVGTFSYGVFYSTDNGISWQNNGIHPRWINEFAIHNSALLTATLGNGVALKGFNSNNWTYLNASLPNYSINVNSIISSTNDIIIAAGSNGTFYRYDFNNSIWNEEYYDGVLHPGLQISKLINIEDTILAVNFNRIIRSNDAGLTWSNDNIDTHNGYSRTIYQGHLHQYTLTNIIPTGTWIQHRDNYAVLGTSWASNEELLPTGFSYDIVEYDNKLFLGKDDGLYMKSTVLGLEEHSSNKEYKIYPNPSTDGIIKLYSTRNIIALKIFNSIGQLMQATSVNGFHTETVLPSGIYYFQLTFSDKVVSSKVIVLK